MAKPLTLANLFQTMLNTFRIGGITGVLLKNNSGALLVRNPGDTADAAVTTSQLKVSGNNALLNSAAAGAGADWVLTLARPSTGMTAAWTLTLPIGPGTAGYILQTDGSGNTSWVASGSTAACFTSDTTTVAYNASSPVTLFTLPANAVVEQVIVTVDTAFNATSPSLTIGISGATSKYTGAGDVDLTTVGVYALPPGLAANASTEALIATFAPGTGGSAGSARIEIVYAIPQ